MASKIRLALAFRHMLFVVGVVYVALISLIGLLDGHSDQKMSVQVVSSAKLREERPQRVVSENGVDVPRRGGIYVHDENVHLSYWALRELARKHEPASKTLGFSVRSNERLSLVLAPALDATLRPVQAFLLGKPPYPAMQILVPLHAIADRLQYQSDEAQFQGRNEVWLTTLQAWTRGKGDCEDHAILLADWLIDMGFDARVVIGAYRAGGHAWVVLFKDGKEYLLEATLKERSRPWSAYPLAQLMPEYHPKIMFNRQLLWVNSGSAMTVSYSGRGWRPVMAFQ